MKKILIPIIIIVLVLGLAAGAYFLFFRPKKSQTVKYSYIRTVTLSNGQLESVVTSSGSVKSSDTSTVTSTTSAKVKTVHVAVGDTVKAGDIIVELDSADLLEQIAEEEESVANRISKAEESLENARENLSDAESEYADYKKERSALAKEYEEALASYQKVTASVAQFEEKVEEASKAMEEAGLAYNDAVISGIDTDGKKDLYDNARGDWQEAKEAYQKAVEACNYNEIVNRYEQISSGYERIRSSISSAERSVEQAEESVKNAEENLEDAAKSDRLDELKEDLDACYLKAETDGKVTSLSATVGSVPMGTVATIQNAEKLKIVISVSETDVTKLSLGLSCRIENDAIDKEILGTLTQLDPISSNSGNFGAEVTVDTENSGLLIGMNASVDIILSSTDVDFSVPIDAVGEDENGSFVYRKTSGSGVDMTFEKVTVTTGEKNDYYIAIESDKLSVGDVIRASADLTEGIEETTASQSGGFDPSGMFGGGSMPGGNMPSGNFPSDFSGGSGSGGFSGGERPSGNFSPRS